MRSVASITYEVSLKHRDNISLIIVSLLFSCLILSEENTVTEIICDLKEISSKAP